jgi:hypothetical protein
MGGEKGDATFHLLRSRSGLGTAGHRLLRGLAAPFRLSTDGISESVPWLRLGVGDPQFGTEVGQLPLDPAEELHR